MLLMSAPLQGFTEASFRHAHAQIYGAADEYFTPFVRVEKGEVRRRDLRDACSALNDPDRCTPQIIAANAEEFSAIVRELFAQGHRRMDLNLGCPFPPQVRQGRGAGLLSHPHELAAIASVMGPQVQWSVKMRLGVDLPRQWHDVIGIINDMPLRHIAVHPRTALQQYRGDLHLESFSELLSKAEHPVIFNGEIRTPEDIARTVELFPSISGVMVGRGLLERPSLFAEYREGEWTEERQRMALLQLHDAIFNMYSSTLCGDSQILMKIKPYWEYFGKSFDRKAVKAITKATTLAAYKQALSRLLG